MKVTDTPDEDALFAVAHVQTHGLWATIWDVKAALELAHGQGPRLLLDRILSNLGMEEA